MLIYDISKNYFLILSINKYVYNHLTSRHNSLYNLQNMLNIMITYINELFMLTYIAGGVHETFSIPLKIISIENIKLYSSPYILL